MYSDPTNFLNAYGKEMAITSNVLGALTDKSLAFEKAPGHGTLGDIAWIIAAGPSYMLNQVGFKIDEVPERPGKLTVATIRDTYNKLASQVTEQVVKKSKADLEKVYRVWNQYDWPAGEQLSALIHHEIHHRGQLTVLMRQVGLPVPRIYGPNYEDTLSQKAGHSAL